MRLTLSASVGLVFIPVALAQATADEDPALAAAQRRQQSIKTVSVQYKRVEVTAKGAVNEASMGPLQPKKPVPSEETTLESVNRLVIDSDRFRLEDNHPVWRVPEGRLLNMQVVNVYDGATGKLFFARGMGDEGKPEGTIEGDIRTQAIKSIVVVPITMTFRGLDPVIGAYRTADMKPSGASLPIDGGTCREYVIDLSGGSLASFWLDPSKDYVVRRIRHQKKGQLQFQVDVSYRRNQTCGWAPASWVISEYGTNGATLRTTQVAILEMQLNTRQAADQFELQFPPGTLVHDNRNLKPYRVQSDGSMRELSAEGEELPGAVVQPGAPWYQAHKWLIVGLIVIVGGMGLLYAMRRRKRSHALE